jgi:hypothetical protein
MSPDYLQRRRIAIAVAITVIAVPAVFLLDRGDGESADVPTSVVGSVVEATSNDDGADQNRPTNETDPMGTSPAAFLEGTVAPQVDDPATIAIPRLPEAVEGDATFSRSIGDVTACHVDPELGAPFGAAVTVTNLDNSHSVRCLNNIGGPAPSASIVLHADAFSQIGDLTDAPVPVQLTW